MTATPQNIQKLNAYPEFRTPAGINTVIQAVTNNQPPQGLTPRQTARFTEKFLNGDWNVVQGRLRYQPNLPNGALPLNLRVALPAQRNQFMSGIWNDRGRGLGIGLQAFYKQVSKSYLNIQKTHTDAFLKSKGDYQIQKTPKKVVVSPIVAKQPNERWGMDLIEMGNKYVLTVVDFFSGYVWARTLSDKTAPLVRGKLNQIIASPFPTGSGGVYPTILQSDQGGEFKGEVSEWSNMHNVRRVRTSSYTPISNGKVERMNREIRKKMKAGYIRNNNRTWEANLPSYIRNINSQNNSTTDISAYELYVAGFQPLLNALPAHENDNTPRERSALQRNYLNVRAVRLQGQPVPDYNVGDLVRVNMASLSNAYRKKVKDNRINTLAVHWSPVVSEVVSVIPPTGNRIRNKYTVRVGPPNGGPPNAQSPMFLKGNTPWELFGNQLTLAGDVVSINPKNIPRADFLNR